LGPTTPVNPSEIIKSVGSTKLLKPFNLNLEILNLTTLKENFIWSGAFKLYF